MPPPRQPWPVRLTHWVNVVLLPLMAMSGLRILNAFPALGPRGETWDWYPFSGQRMPEWLTLGGWLAGARHWHFAVAWLFLINGLAYLGWLIGSGQWRQRLFLPRRDFPDALRTIGEYLRLRSSTSPGLYNGLQRLAYTSTLPVTALVVGSGLAMWKPVQLQWLAAAFGGYDAARAVHLIGLAVLALFTVGHVVMVALHPRTLVEMTTGGGRDDA